MNVSNNIAGISKFLYILKPTPAPLSFCKIKEVHSINSHPTISLHIHNYTEAIYEVSYLFSHFIKQKRIFLLPTASNKSAVKDIYMHHL